MKVISVVYVKYSWFSKYRVPFHIDFVNHSYISYCFTFILLNSLTLANKILSTREYC